MASANGHQAARRALRVSGADALPVRTLGHLCDDACDTLDLAVDEIEVLEVFGLRWNYVLDQQKRILDARKPVVDLVGDAATSRLDLSSWATRRVLFTLSPSLRQPGGRLFHVGSLCEYEPHAAVTIVERRQRDIDRMSPVPRTARSQPIANTFTVSGASYAAFQLFSIPWVACGPEAVPDRPPHRSTQQRAHLGSAPVAENGPVDREKHGHAGGAGMSPVVDPGVIAPRITEMGSDTAPGLERLPVVARSPPLASVELGQKLDLGVNA